MELLAVKLLVLFLSGAVRLVFGLIPFLLVKLISPSWSQNSIMSRVISFLMFFGGGVLLATCFLHLMPEVRESFATALPQVEFPVAEIVFLVGFFLVYLLEDVVHTVVHRRRRNKNKKKELSANSSLSSSGTIHTISTDFVYDNNKQAGLHNRAIAPVVVPSSNAIHCIHSNISQEGVNSHYVNNNRGIELNKCDSGSHNGTAVIISNNKICTNNANDLDWWKDTIHSQTSRLNLLSVSCSCVPNVGKESANPVIIPETEESEKSNCDEDSNSHGHSHSHIPMETDDGSFSAELRNILIIVAISFHGVFEGMAIGLQKTEKDLWYLFLAVSLHECTILFCIGVELISSKTKVLRMMVYILVVSMVCPIGIAIGIVVTEHSFGEGNIHVLTVGIFQGLAAGTLMYVTFFEIFQEEGRKISSCKCLYLITALVGFFLMSSLEFMGGHNHGHETTGNASLVSSSGHQHDHHDDHFHGNHGDHHHVH